MKKLLVSIAFAFTGIVSFAQQDAQFSQFMFNQLAVNPAYAGTNGALCGTLLGRQQWIQFPGAPKTYLLSVESALPLPLPIGTGAGLTVMSDQLGFDKSFMAKAAFSGHIPVGGSGAKLCIGLEIGMLQKTLNGSWVAPDGSTTASGNISDPSIPQGTGLNDLTYDLGAGIYYTSDDLYFGISTTHLPGNALKGTGSITFDLARHYYIQAGYTYHINAEWALKPAVLVKTDAASTQLDANLIVEWDKFLWAGASYRLTDAIVAMIGAKRQLNANLSVKGGVAYDITTSNIKNYSKNTFEFMLGACYNIIKPPKPQSHSNVRFMN